MDRLLAKSGTDAPTLLEHTRDVMDAAVALFGTAGRPTRLGDCWCRFFRLADAEWAKFHGSLLAACGLHDWGKANDGFQAAMHRRGQQAIRHEHLSALLVAQPPVWDWLGRRPDLDREVILSAVLTHHLKAGTNANRPFNFADPIAGGTMSLRSWHGTDAFRPIVEPVAKSVGLKAGDLDLSAIPERWDFTGLVSTERDRVKKEILLPFGDVVDLKQFGDVVRLRRLMAVRAGLIVADAAGSGLRRTKRRVQEWITETMAELRPLTRDEIEGSVIERRVAHQKALGRWIDKRDGKGGWTDFQIACIDLPDRALLLAPCGSGKTLAAWRWIAARLGERPASRVLFLYPTRATATEGFRDYVSWAPEGDPALMHGTSGFDLDDMFGNPAGDDPRDKRVYRVPEDEQRLFALAYWGRRAFSATVDQFLAFLQYGYGPVCMLPVLADSVVVIDEIHSFDNSMFAALKGFLQNFHVPVLCMTATLPADRREVLTATVEVGGCGLTAYPGGQFPPDLKELAEKPRYRLRRVAGRAEAEGVVRQALVAGKRVLWVVNQVKRAQSIVRGMVPDTPADGELFARVDGCPDPVPVVCYHSRFKLTDRVSRHKRTMQVLKDGPRGPALGVTTQVCEMSLDIDVDLLVTEECPVSALVQRMGRCNREAKSPRPLGDPTTPGTAGDVLVCPPDDGDHAPYAGRDNNLLRGLKEFLDRFADGTDLSQAQIDAVFQDDKFPCPKPPGDGVCMFLESGPFAVAGEEEFRDSEEFNRPCVLTGDVEKYLSETKDKQPGWVLPVPRRRAQLREWDDPTHHQLPGYLQVADDAHYHRLTGFHDEPLTPKGGE